MSPITLIIFVLGLTALGGGEFRGVCQRPGGERIVDRVDAGRSYNRLTSLSVVESPPSARKEQAGIIDPNNADPRFSLAERRTLSCANELLVNCH